MGSPGSTFVGCFEGGTQSLSEESFDWLLPWPAVDAKNVFRSLAFSLSLIARVPSSLHMAGGRLPLLLKVVFIDFYGKRFKDLLSRAVP